MDDHGAGNYFSFLQAFSTLPVLSHRELPPQSIVRFARAHIGLSRALTWYQYGYTGPQGPIAGKTVNGSEVRWMARFIAERMGVPGTLGPVTPSNPRPGDLVIFSRLSNRRVLNERALATGLAAAYGREPVFVRLEELSLTRAVAIMGGAELVVGMHGSIHALDLFLPPGARVIELYPFAVPPDNYTPYKTLAQLTGLEYRAWANPDRQSSIGHPDWPPLLGGLGHLDESERNRIIELETVPAHRCCEDPVWLYKIYQDTNVDVDALVQLTVKERWARRPTTAAPLDEDERMRLAEDARRQEESLEQQARDGQALQAEEANQDQKAQLEQLVRAQLMDDIESDARQAEEERPDAQEEGREEYQHAEQQEQQEQQQEEQERGKRLRWRGQ